MWRPGAVVLGGDQRLAVSVGVGVGDQPRRADELLSVPRGVVRAPGDEQHEPALLGRRPERADRGEPVRRQIPCHAGPGDRSAVAVGGRRRRHGIAAHGRDADRELQQRSRRGPGQLERALLAGQARPSRLRGLRRGEGARPPGVDHDRRCPLRRGEHRAVAALAAHEGDERHRRGFVSHSGPARAPRGRRESPWRCPRRRSPCLGPAPVAWGRGRGPARRRRCGRR